VNTKTVTGTVLQQTNNKGVKSQTNNRDKHHYRLESKEITEQRASRTTWLLYIRSQAAALNFKTAHTKTPPTQQHFSPTPHYLGDNEIKENKEETRSDLLLGLPADLLLLFTSRCTSLPLQYCLTYLFNNSFI